VHALAISKIFIVPDYTAALVYLHSCALLFTGTISYDTPNVALSLATYLSTCTWNNNEVHAAIIE
jgi:hypothetical protein